MTEAASTPEPAIESLAGDGFVGAIDLGGTKILCAIVSPIGQIVARAKKKSTTRGSDPTAVIDRIADCLREAASTAGVPVDQLRAVGIGAPGPVVQGTGVVVVAVNLGWHNVPLRAELEKRLGVTVAVDNDVRVAVLAEHVSGAGRGTQSMVGIWPGTGVGGGVIVNGELVTGANHAAGEIGHMTIKAGGPLCACGGKGHLEALASRTAIVRDIVEATEKGKKTALTAIVKGDVAKSTTSDLAEALRLGDKVVIEAVNRSAKYLAIGIASLANLLNPEAIVLGGGLIQGLGESFVRQVAKNVEGRPMLAATQPLRIIQSTLGDDAGIIGSALLARRQPTGRPTEHVAERGKLRRGSPRAPAAAVPGADDHG
jgi:glucokinase